MDRMCLCLAVCDVPADGRVMCDVPADASAVPADGRAWQCVMVT